MSYWRDFQTSSTEFALHRPAASASRACASPFDSVARTGVSGGWCSCMGCKVEWAASRCFEARILHSRHHPALSQAEGRRSERRSTASADERWASVDGLRASGNAGRASGEGGWASGGGVRASADGVRASGNGPRASGNGGRASQDGLRASVDAPRASADGGRASVRHARASENGAFRIGCGGRRDARPVRRLGERV